MCRTCHSAPGRQPSTIQQGLNPKPPKLDSERVQKRTDGALYWIIKNGIRVTGMPAFGKTHTDEAIWSLLAFVRQLPQLHGPDYEAMLKAGRFARRTGGGTSIPTRGTCNVKSARHLDEINRAHQGSLTRLGFINQRSKAAALPCSPSAVRSWQHAHAHSAKPWSSAAQRRRHVRKPVRRPASRTHPAWQRLRPTV